MNRFLLYVVFMGFTAVYAQEIKLNLKDETLQDINAGNVLFKEKNSAVVSEFAQYTGLHFKYKLKKKYQYLVIEITSTGYGNETIFVAEPNSKSMHEFTIVLKKIKTEQLQEIVIKPPERAFIVKKDTVVFDVKKYRDGSERKVEDLLKKLPGIAVDKNGGVTYKGKALETVTLDGDNLFNNNYKIGTKNININIVESIEAIENYAANKLLKGLESEGKVSLNLKIMKGKIDFSIDTENALGVNVNGKLLHYAHVNLLQIAKFTKSFSVFNANNIGRSDTYFYEKNTSISLDKVSEEKFKTKQLIRDDLFTPDIDAFRFNFNNQYFGSYNTLFKITKNFNIKLNLNYINDKINSNQKTTNTNFIGSNVLETSDENIATKSPNIFTAELELKYNITKKTLLEIYNKQYWENTNYQNMFVRNNFFASNITNNTKNYLAINKMVHTWKTSNLSALQGNLYFTSNDINQNFINNDIVLPLEQFSAYKKNVFLANYNLIGRHNKHNYLFQIGSNVENTNFQSRNNLNAANNNVFKTHAVNQYSKVKFVFGKFNIVPTLLITSYKLDLPTNNLIKKSTVFEPTLDLVYKQGESTFSVNTIINQKPVSEEFIYSQNVIISNRIQNFNIPSLDFIKSQSIGFNYFYNSLTSNSTFSFSSIFQANNGLFLENILIENNFTVFRNKFFSESNTSVYLILKAATFIEKLSTNFTYGLNCVQTSYPNILNDSDIRKNSNIVLKNNFEFRTGFLTRLNFENNFSATMLKSTSDFNPDLVNHSIQNNFEIKYRVSSSIKTKLKSNLFVPDVRKSNNFNFIDFELQYNPKEKFNFFFIVQNILNQSLFTQKSNNDFSQFTSTINLLPAYFLTTMEYNF